MTTSLHQTPFEKKKTRGDGKDPPKLLKYFSIIENTIHRVPQCIVQRFSFLL